MPSVAVNNGTTGARTLPAALDPALDQVAFTPLGAKDKMTTQNGQTIVLRR